MRENIDDDFSNDLYKILLTTDNAVEIFEIAIKYYTKEEKKEFLRHMEENLTIQKLNEHMNYLEETSPPIFIPYTSDKETDELMFRKELEQKERLEAKYRELLIIKNKIPKLVEEINATESAIPLHFHPFIIPYNDEIKSKMIEKIYTSLNNHYFIIDKEEFTKHFDGNNYSKIFWRGTQGELKALFDGLINTILFYVGKNINESIITHFLNNKRKEFDPKQFGSSQSSNGYQDIAFQRKTNVITTLIEDLRKIKPPQK